jgi:hypothetical protein
MASPEIDLSTLADGKLHLIGFCGDKFVYLVTDPTGSELVLYDALVTKFPLMVRQMLADSQNSLKSY